MCMFIFNRKIIYSQHEKCKSEKIRTGSDAQLFRSTHKFLVLSATIFSCFGLRIDGRRSHKLVSLNLDDINKRSATITLVLNPSPVLSSADEVYHSCRS